MLNITIKCPNCGGTGKHMESEDSEKLKAYAFNCIKCGFEFGAPKDNPNIIIVKGELV